jgi:putative transposase
LTENSVKIGRRKASVLMKEEGLKAIQTKAFKSRATDSKGASAAPNLLAGVNLEECAVGKIIIGDITYIRLRGGKFCYLAGVAG